MQPILMSLQKWIIITVVKYNVVELSIGEYCGNKVKEILAAGINYESLLWRFGE